MFTALHRVLGLSPGPITDELIDAAVEAGVEETDDLDWKSELPPTSNLNNADFPKDVAAMANSGGGVIVYGVTESQEKATGRKDTGELTENHERSLRQVAVSAISPPIFGLNIIRVGDDGNRAVAVVVPASVDGPHLIYRNDYFGAPVRNNADTVWMREREIATQYRARFDAARHATEVLDKLYEETASGRDITERAWLIAVAHPRAASAMTRWSRDEARELLKQARMLTVSFASNDTLRPLESVDWQNPRPGLRRWTAPNTMIGETARWREASLSIQFDGSITVAAAAGAHRRASGFSEEKKFYEGWWISELVVEAAVADLMALVRTVGLSIGAVEYEVRVGIEWAGKEPLTLYRRVQGFDEDEGTVPVHRFIPVETTVEVRDNDDAGYLEQVRELALDCVNQGGVMYLHLIKEHLGNDIR
ncbi:MAG: ATP-binding protein [Mycobacterium sp.]|uniref:AlbA family DNA-binding domain-containing protein n=1 Tax=Mycobacterium sp. TaxID=1785 RepID=UPI003CC574D6